MKRLPFLRRSPLTEFANEGEAEFIVENEAPIALGGADGWFRLAPFGDFPGMARHIGAGDRVTSSAMAVQRFDAEAANEMVAAFKSPFGRLARWFKGVQIFHGHPDAPGIGDSYPDKAPKGMIADLQVRADGLYAQPTFNNEGADLLESTTGLAPSARWGSRLITTEGGQQIFRPAILRSVGLTTRPNLPVETINEAPEMNLATIIAALKKAGVDIANEATEADALAALEKTGTAAATVTAELANERSQVSALTAAKTTAETELANERTARITDILDLGQETGRITEAERATWSPRLTANFANERAALLALPVKVKLGTAVDAADRKARSTPGAEAGGRLQEIANEKFNAHPNRVTNPQGAYAECWQAAERENPALAAAQKSTAA